MGKISYLLKKKKTRTCNLNSKFSLKINPFSFRKFYFEDIIVKFKGLQPYLNVVLNMYSIWHGENTEHLFLPN